MAMNKRAEILFSQEELDALKGRRPSVAYRWVSSSAMPCVGRIFSRRLSEGVRRSNS
jgi:hypothetical protein